MFLIFTVALIFGHPQQILAEYGQLSKRMCEKYAEAVYNQQEDLGMSSATGFHNVSQCGIASVPLILGGTKASPMEFPHFALIGYGLNPDMIWSWDCGGTLISEKFVLSAGHCQAGRLGSALKVALGIVNKPLPNKVDPTGVLELIEETIVHPDFHPPHKYNDILLFKLKNEVKFTPYIRPACLNTDVQPMKGSATAIGFGTMSDVNQKSSDDLLKVTLEFMPHEKCRDLVESHPLMAQGVTDSIICSTSSKSKTDTCNGDSGGPLTVTLVEPYCMYSLVGVIASGFSCGYKNVPSLNTNVSEYLPWIESHVWPNVFT